MELNRMFKNQWEKWHKVFHLMEILDFFFPTEFQNPEKLPENWKNYHSLTASFILVDIFSQKYLLCVSAHVTNYKHIGLVLPAECSYKRQESSVWGVFLVCLWISIAISISTQLIAVMKLWHNLLIYTQNCACPLPTQIHLWLCGWNVLAEISSSCIISLSYHSPEIITKLMSIHYIAVPWQFFL